MKRNGENYVGFLEAVVISLLYEREKNGKHDLQFIHGIDDRGQPAYYSPYNIKESIQQTRMSDGSQDARMAKI